METELLGRLRELFVRFSKHFHAVRTVGFESPLRSCQNMIVVVHVEGEVLRQAMSLFGRAPGSSEEAIDVGSNHGTGVV